MPGPDQRMLARYVLTKKQYKVWEAIEIKGLSYHKAAWHFDLNRRTVIDMHHRAQQIMRQASIGEFRREQEENPATPDVADNRLAVALLIERDGSNCYLCRKAFPAGELEVEHIIPRSQGGSNDADNLALACQPCNLAKGSKFVSIRVPSGAPMYHHA